MARHLVTAALLIGLTVTAGCGSSESTTTTSKQDQSEAAFQRQLDREDAAEQKAKDSAKRGTFAAVRSCATSYDVARAGNALGITRRRSSDVQLVRVQSFDSAADAQAFYQQLEVDGEQRGRLVAIFPTGVNERFRSKVTQCLSAGH